MIKKLFKICFILLVSLLVVGCGSNNNNSIEKISTSEVKEIIDNKDDNYIIIDVREEYEFNEGHLPRAENIPWTIIDTYTFDKDKTIIVYCRSGSRSNEAAKILNKLGYKVKDMGGILDWTYELKGVSDDISE